MSEKPIARERTLLEMCLDLQAHPEFLEDTETAKLMLDGFIRDEILKFWAHDLEGNFDEALKQLKTSLRPCADLFTNADLCRIIGTEIAWIREAENMSPLNGAPPQNLRKAREDFVSEARLGVDPLLDSASPTKQMMELESYIRSWADFPAFGFGIRALDDATGGILPGEICILTGAPGTMKTSLALCVVDDLVTRAEKGLVIYCSVDMARREITHRMIEREARIPQAAVRSMFERDDPEIGSMRKMISKKYDGRLVILGHGKTDAQRMTIPRLLHECLKRQPQLIVIDYLTRLKERGQSDLEFVEDAMPRILDYAHQYEASFLILSQMSRSSRAEQATGRVGGHGKGGGIVEELAHTEIELFQQPIEGDKPMVIAAVTKARRGVSGQFFSLDYNGPIKRFSGGATKMSKTVQKKAIFAPANDSFYGRPSQ